MAWPIVNETVGVLLAAPATISAEVCTCMEGRSAKRAGQSATASQLRGHVDKAEEDGTVNP